MSLSISGGAAETRPNVLLIAIDDMNDWVGCLGGHPNTHTPNIDRLAKRGTLFTNAHCQAPICNPSRTSIMYGLRPSTSGVYKNAPKPWTVAELNNHVTMPRWFARNGYFTATAGKLYHGSGLPNGDFDLVGPRPGQRLKLDRQIRQDLPNRTSKLWDFGPQDHDETLFQDHIDASWAIEQLQQKYDQPLFLTVGFYRPHVPFYAPTRIFKNHLLADTTLPSVKLNDRNDLPQVATTVTHNSAPPAHSWFVEHNAWKPAVQAYLACIQWTDEQVGRLLDALDQSPHADNTIVVLYSDHGFHLGEKQRWTKFSLWERSTHVPFIIDAPGLPGGQNCSRPTELLSVYPTLAELCELPANSDVEGRSLLPLLKNQHAAWPHLALTTHGLNNHAVRADRYRYIRYHDGAEELYDMQHDPNEWANLVSDNISVEHRMIIKGLASRLPKVNVRPAKARGGSKRK